MTIKKYLISLINWIPFVSLEKESQTKLVPVTLHLAEILGETDYLVKLFDNFNLPGHPVGLCWHETGGFIRNQKWTGPGSKLWRDDELLIWRSQLNP